MQQYLNLLKHIKENGVSDSDRTGTGTVSVFGYQMRFNLQKGFPLLTTKKLHLRSIIHELLWFLKGETNIKYLKDNNVTIWDEWADENGELGPIYGKQWRSWENLVLQSEDENIQNKSIDQISWVINRLKTNPSCRRIIVSAWNVSDIPKMKLAPCHCLFQFYTFPLSIEQRIQHLIKKELYTSQKISKDTPEIEKILNQENIPMRGLSCQLYQRSADVPLGVGFNIASYALLTMMIAQCVNMIPSEFIWTGGNCHIYNNQWDGINQQLERNPLPLPTMKINPDIKNIFDFKYEDFTLENYTYHPAIKMPVAI